jgi:hypothetical protein
MRYRLRTLLILLAILPPLLWLGWTKFAAWQAEQERLRAIAEEDRRIPLIIDDVETEVMEDLSVSPFMTTKSLPADTKLPAPAPAKAQE